MTKKEFLDAFKTWDNPKALDGCGYRLDYQGLGHEGNIEIGGKKWKTDVHCFSDVCMRGANIVVRKMPRHKTAIPKLYWKRLITAMCEIEGNSRKAFEAKYEKYYQCRFRNENPYRNYLTFVLWRLSVQQPKGIALFLHIKSKGFDTIQSFMIMMSLQRMWYKRIYGGALLEGVDTTEPGLYERLKECSLKHYNGAYSMRGRIVKQAWEKVPFIYRKDVRPKDCCKALYNRVWEQIN